MAFTKINAAGIGTTETVTVDGLTVINNGSFGGNLSVGGTLTYEDVTNVDSVGLITARNGIVVGSGITLSKDGDVFATGVTTTGSLVSSGAISGTTGTFTGDVDIADKIVHTGDTNTAIRFPAADTITAETGGSERARLGSSGEVYFGTSNWPTGSLGKAAGRVMMGNEGSLTIWNETNSAGGGGTLKLACKEGSDATRVGFVNLVGGTENTSDRSSFFKIQVSNSSGSGIERLRIKSDGNVEIGGGTHSRRLAVHDTTNSVILIEGASNGTSNLMFGDENDEDVGMLGYNHGSNYLAFTVNAAERLRITSGGNLEVKASGADASRSIKIEGTNGSSELQQVVLESDGENGKFFINAAAGNGTPTDKFTINTITGNIGINESSPAAPLHISTPASTTCEIRLTSNNTGSGAGDRGRINVRSSRNDGSAYQAGYVDIDRSSGTEDKAHLLVALNDGSGASERIRITSSGQILIGATSNTMGGHFELTKNIGFNDCAIAIKRLNTTITSRSFMRFVDFNGNAQGSIGMGSNTVSYNTSSDYRLKENQVAISDGIARLKNLKPYRFNFKVDPDKTVDGFFAHEVTPIIPEAVTGEKDAEDMQQLDYAKLTPLLTAALQEAVTEIESLKARLDAAGL
jgi:hypothetical protein